MGAPRSCADLSQIQPRLGLAWDVGGDGKTIGRFSWGRFMHPSALTTASFAQRGANLLPAVTAFSCNYVRTVSYSLAPDDPTPCSVLAGWAAADFGWMGDVVQEPGLRDPEGWIVATVTGAGVPNLVDPDLDPTFQHTIIIGVERQIFDRTSVELSYVNKDTEDIFEDTCNGALTNPAVGHACDFYVMANLPGLRREYDGVILRAESRATDWLHLTSSLTWSESKGNVEYTQNAGVDVDFFPEHYANTFGYLSDQARWRFKVNGYVDLPLDFGLGVNAFWSSSSVWNVERPAEIAGYGTELIEPRGSLQGNDNYQLDLQATKAIRFGNDMSVQLIAAVINVFDSERPIELCEREDGCGGDGLGNSIDWQRPRQYQVGFRFEF